MKKFIRQSEMESVTPETGGDRKFTSSSRSRSHSRGLADWIVLAVLALGITHGQGAYATVMVNFDLSFTEGARLNGMFTAQDINNDLFITEDEVTTATATYHKGTTDTGITGDIMLTAPPETLYRLNFDLSTELLRELHIYHPGTVSGLDIIFAENAVHIIAGAYISPEHTELAQANRVSVPEPTTLVLLGVGLAGLGFTRRRMRA